MTKLNFDSTGNRIYENGVDRGVLYVGVSPGVVWPGLISVSESPTGGDSKAFYYDGIKYYNGAATEEFEATIEAFSAPREFATCEGMTLVKNGLVLAQQRRKPFNFVYRTKIGSDTRGGDYGYKLHLVYNALAQPTSRSNHTVNDSQDLDTLSWAITTRPPAISGFKRTAHLVVESLKTPPALLAQLEDILYGTGLADPRIPSPQEIYALFDAYIAPTITDNGDGSWTFSESLATTDGQGHLTISSSVIVDYSQGVATIAVPQTE